MMTAVSFKSPKTGRNHNFKLYNDIGLKNGWLIRTSTKSFAVYAPTDNGKTEWMTYINKCIEDLLKKSTLLIINIIIH